MLDQTYVNRVVKNYDSLIEAIESHEVHGMKVKLNMWSWLKAPTPSCGTSACLMGHILLLKEGHGDSSMADAALRLEMEIKGDLIDHREQGASPEALRYSEPSMCQEGAEFLGLTYAAAEDLFASRKAEMNDREVALTVLRRMREAFAATKKELNLRQLSRMRDDATWEVMKAKEYCA